MSAEIKAALGSDLRVLTGGHWNVSVDNFPVESQEGLIERAYFGLQAIERIIRDSVKPRNNSLSSDHASTTETSQLMSSDDAQSAVDIVRLTDLCLSPRPLAKFIDSTYTCCQMFPVEFRESFTSEDGDNQFGDQKSVFQTILFYSSLSSFSSNLKTTSLLSLLARIRSVLYPHEPSSILAPEEEDFSVEVLDAFFIPSTVPIREVKKQIINSVLRSSPGDLDSAKTLLTKSPKIRHSMLSDSNIHFFMTRYFSNGSLFFTSPESASNGLFSLISLFTFLNVGIPGRLSRNSWIDRLASKIQKVNIIFRIYSIQPAVVTRERPQVERNIFNDSLRNFSENSNPKQFDIMSPPRANPVDPFPVPCIYPISISAPRLVPQQAPKSPGLQHHTFSLEPPVMPTTPPRRRFTSEDDYKVPPLMSPALVSPPLMSPPLVPQPAKIAQTGLPIPASSTGAEKELVVKSLVRSGMSPKRAVRVATQFVEGGTSNLEALRKVVASAGRPRSVSPQTRVELRRK